MKMGRRQDGSARVMPRADGINRCEKKGYCFFSCDRFLCPFFFPFFFSSFFSIAGGAGSGAGATDSGGADGAGTGAGAGIGSCATVMPVNPINSTPDKTHIAIRFVMSFLPPYIGWLTE